MDNNLEKAKINTEEENKQEENNKKEIIKKKNKIRRRLVIAFLVLFFAISYIELRGSYLEYLELGQNYISIFKTNMMYRYGIMAIIFIVLYFVLYMTNRGIKKGLKPFFDKEKKEMPKLPNKSLALVISSIFSIIISSALAPF